LLDSFSVVDLLEASLQDYFLLLIEQMLNEVVVETLALAWKFKTVEVQFVDHKLVVCVDKVFL
jgi:hypothetical protein